MTAYLVPGLFLLVFGIALRQRIHLYDALTEGALDGLTLMVRIVPALVILLSAVAMLRASGALDAASLFLSPVFKAVGIPPETAPLMLVRPMSGSAALAVGIDLMKNYGPDSRIGLTSAIMLGSTETTFYTISVYFGAAKVRGTRHAIPAALMADLAGFLSSALAVNLFFPNA